MSAQAWITSRFPSLGRGARAIAAIALVQLGGACGGSGDPPTQPPSGGTDSVSKMVGPGGGLVVTPGGFAGVDIPAGALNQNVLVTIVRLPDPATPGAGPLPTALKQYPPYYEYQTQPAVPQFGDLVRVGLCQVRDPASPFYPPAATHDRLRLAHPDPANPQTVEILERVGVDDFLRCAGVQASSSPWKRAGSSTMLCRSADQRSFREFAARFAVARDSTSTRMRSIRRRRHGITLANHRIVFVTNC